MYFLQLIELWETYLLQLDSDEDGPPLMPAGLHAESQTPQPRPGEGEKAQPGAEAHEDAPSLSGTTAIGAEGSEVRASEETAAS
jgi:sorting nexin-1/2